MLFCLDLNKICSEGSHLMTCHEIVLVKSNVASLSFSFEIKI